MSEREGPSMHHSVTTGFLGAHVNPYDPRSAIPIHSSGDGIVYNMKGKVAFVTGGGSGIGKAIAEVFAESGCDVCVFDINQKSADESKEMIEGLGRKALAVQGDIRQYDEMERAAQLCVQELGGLDFVVANAGIARTGSILSMSGDDFDKVVAVNMKGTFNTVKACAREMVKLNRGGRIVTISSANGVIAGRLAGAYCGSKAAINHMSRCWAQDLAPYDITVNCVGPGATNTDLMVAQIDNPDAQEGLKRAIPLNRMAHPREVGHTAVFFCSDGARYLTGTFLLLDGGLRDHDAGDADTIAEIRAMRTTLSGKEVLDREDQNMAHMVAEAEEQRRKFSLH